MARRKVWNQPTKKEISEKQKTNCLNCMYNPMTDAEFVAARLTGEVNFICGHNGMFRIRDINNGNFCRNRVSATLSHLLEQPTK